MSAPLVSFVLPVYNRRNVITRALDDIIREREENYSNIEIVVIDGGSKDGTAEIVREYGSKIDTFISERDRGVADAFNKGVRAAKGEIIRYIASDDEMIPGHTRYLVEHMAKNPEIDVLGAQSECWDILPDGTRKIVQQATDPHGGWMDINEVITWSHTGVFAFIETWFMRRHVFERAGYLDLKYRVATDVDFAFLLVESGARFFVAPDCILHKYHYRDGSNNISNLDVMLSEHREIVLRHAGMRPAAWWALYRWPAPLHSRIFWSAWISAGKGVQKFFPSGYRAVQRLTRRGSPASEIHS
jgi:glycosyltransferase involved in cell wall biosynthesis